MSRAVQQQLSNVHSLLPPPAHTKPILKWAGGKSWMTSYIGSTIWGHLSITGGRYFEPFLGGGAVALHLGLDRMVLNDVLEPLIEFYKAVVKMPAAVDWALRALGDRWTDSDTYYAVRASRPRGIAQRAARFLYINKLGYNGLYRENASGGCNVPFGKRKSKTNPFPSVERLKEVSKAFGTATLLSRDFEHVLRDATRGDLVYVDPPYDGVEFTHYKGGGFSADDQERLAYCLKDATERGATIIANNADTPHVRSIYQWMLDYGGDFINVHERRAINSKGDDRGGVGCLLMTTNVALVRT